MNKDIYSVIISKLKCSQWFNCSLVCKEWYLMIKKLKEQLFKQVEFITYEQQGFVVKYYDFEGYDIVERDFSEHKIVLYNNGLIHNNNTNPYLLMKINEYTVHIYFHIFKEIPEYILKQINQTFKHFPDFLYDYRYEKLETLLKSNPTVYVFKDEIIRIYNLYDYMETMVKGEIELQTIVPLIYKLSHKKAMNASRYTGCTF